MADGGLRITDVNELRVLHKALYALKFDRDEQDILMGSPFLASVQEQVLTALVAATAGADEQAVARNQRQWDEWASADVHAREVDAVRQHLALAGKWWRDADAERRRKVVRDLLAPLKASPELLASLTSEPGAAS